MASFSLPASSVSSSSGSGWGSMISGMFGGGSSGGSSSGIWGNIFQGILGGLGAMASGNGNQGLSADQQVGLGWHQEEAARRNIGYAAEMEDYMKQKDKMRKRAALDTYGQFSLLSKYAPNYKAAPPVDPGTKPGLW